MGYILFCDLLIIKRATQAVVLGTSIGREIEYETEDFF
jgi:hypothetical protein